MGLQEINMQPLVIVSSGAEILSSYLLEWVVRSRHENFSAIALNKKSMLDGMGFPVHHIDDYKRTRALEKFIKKLDEIAKENNNPVISVASDDDSHGLLIDAKKVLGNKIKISTCYALENGGLSKAEVFNYLKKANLDHLAAKSVIVYHERELDGLCEHFDGEFIIKPDQKPWKKNLQHGVKIFHGTEISQNREEISALLKSGTPWLAQERLKPFPDGERCVWVARNSLGCVTGEYVEHIKYPAAGGSGTWVKAIPTAGETSHIAAQIADVLDLHGLAEIPFLLGFNGTPKMLEINSRPWLQTELIETAGYDIVQAGLAAINESPIPPKTDYHQADWLHLERMLLAILKNDGLGTIGNAKSLFRALRQKPRLAVWSNTLPSIRSRYINIIFSKLMR